MNAIEANSLTKTYRRFFGRGSLHALRGVDLRIPEGTAFGLIGPNGAGKTTFIKTILGVLRPTSGSVRALGSDPDDPKVRRRIGYLPERLHLPASWRPEDLLASVARLKGLKHAKAEIGSLLVRVGLAPDAHRKIGGFSKGMRQRLGLAAALLGSPDLLVLDEPTDGIDPLGRMEVRQILADERKRGATLFLNSHLLAETERVCERIGILAGGKLVREGSLQELTRAGTRWVVRFAPGPSAETLSAVGFMPLGDRFRCEAADPSALNALLDKARKAGALLVELAPDEKDLEAVLADALGRPT